MKIEMEECPNLTVFSLIILAECTNFHPNFDFHTFFKIRNLLNDDVLKAMGKN
jgi:hypothetical protein